MTIQLKQFIVNITETVVTTKTITLAYEDGKITNQYEAEKYCKEALDNIGFGEITECKTTQDEYELTFNGKQDCELEEDEYE